MKDKGLPKNWETEKSVLGCVLLDPGRLDEVREVLAPEDFHRPAHHVLFALCIELADKGGKPDLLVVLDAIEARGIEEKTGGIAYVSARPQAVASVDNAAVYAARVREAAMRRRLLLAFRDGEERVHRGEDAADVHAEMERALFMLGMGLRSEQAPDIGQLVNAELADLDQRLRNPGMITGVPTGFTDLDRKLCGLQKGDLIVLGARPSQGKTSALTCIAVNIARTSGPVGIFSMEQGAQAITGRMILSEARVNGDGYRAGSLSDDDYRRVLRASDQVAALPILIDDRRALRLDQVRSQARKWKAQHPDLRALFVDYLGLMGWSGPKGARHDLEIGVRTSGLRLLAKELGVPVFVLSQLSRALESRTDKRPMMSDLKDSGSIEADADVIMFLYRDEYYNPDSPHRGIAELIVAKQRQGSTGTVKLAFRGEQFRFDNMADDPGPSTARRTYHDEDAW